MKYRCWVAVFALTAVFALPAAAVITPATIWDPTNPNDELNLYEIYNALYGTSFTTNSDMDHLQVTMETITLNELQFATLTARARYAGSTERFGFYDAGAGASPDTELFHVTDYGFVSGYSASFGAWDTGEFGFFLDPVGRRAGPSLWFSESAANGGEQHMLVYRTPFANTYMLAWEDLPFAISDFDYNDLVIELTIGIIPEPASMLLLGLGVAGMAVAHYRRTKASQA